MPLLNQSPPNNRPCNASACFCRFVRFYRVKNRPKREHARYGLSEPLQSTEGISPVVGTTVGGFIDSMGLSVASKGSES